MGSELTGYAQMAPQKLYSSSSVKLAALGQKHETEDGRTFRYTLAGELLVVGDLYQTAAHSANYVSMALSASAAIDDIEVIPTLGSSATTADQFADGYLTVSASTGIGQMFVIKSNTAADATTGTPTFVLKDKIRVALVAAASTISVIKNPFDSVVKFAVTQTGSPVGTAVYPVASGEYGWLQTGGPGACLSDTNATGADGTGLSPSTTTAGTCALAVTTHDRIGGAMQVVTVSAEVGFVRLDLD